MELELIRKPSTESTTLGDLYVNGEYFCHTLEDPVREIGPNGEGKIMGETAIPAGAYRVIINISPRFKKLFPRLLDVPHFTGILIHGGNSAEDTHGCILVGDKVIGDRIAGGTSSPAFKRLLATIQTALDAGEECWITIMDAEVPK